MIKSSAFESTRTKDVSGLASFLPEFTVQCMVEHLKARVVQNRFMPQAMLLTGITFSIERLDYADRSNQGTSNKK